MNRTDTIIYAAVRYAKRGWHILPVGYNKKPLIDDWTKAASTSHEDIVEWWLKYPNANIGIATGRKSGFFVIDIDIRDGRNGLDSLTHRFGDRFDFDVMKFLAGKTPSGGLHLLFKYDSTRPVKTIANVLPGVDIRGDGGQVLVAPSIRKEGEHWLEYRWNDFDLPLSEITPWVEELIGLTGDPINQRVDLNKLFTGIHEGSRDVALHRASCLFASHGIPYQDAALFIEIFAERCVPPFDKREAITKVRQAYGWWESERTRRMSLHEIDGEVSQLKEKLETLTSNDKGGQAHG